MHDIGAVGLEVNFENDPSGRGTRVDTHSAGFNQGLLAKLITSVVQPLLTRMQTSTNSTVKALGVGLGAAVAILTAFLSGGF